MACWSVREHLKKGYKEVVNFFSQLSNVGMLIYASFIPIYWSYLDQIIFQEIPWQVVADSD